MMSILHGDDEVKIHAELNRLLSDAKNKNIQIVRADAKELGIPMLENMVGTDELFANEKLVIIDRLHSLPKSNLKDQFILWLETRVKRLEISVVLVENRVLTATQLKKFAKAKVKLFKLPALLFSFVDALGFESIQKLIIMFHQVIGVQEAELVFAMLARQIRILILYSSDGSYAGPPFGQAKIVKQAKRFTIEKLLSLHRKLVDIDLKQKTSTSPLSLSQEIDLWLANI